MQSASKTRRRGKGKSTNKAEVARFAGDAYDLASRAYRGVTKIAKLINIETKFFETYVGTTLNNTPVVTYLSTIPQGTNQSERVGNSLRIQRMQFNYLLTIPTTTVATDVRIVLIRDLENVGANPAWTDVFPSASLASLQQLLFVNKERFSILHSEALVIQPLSFNGVCKHVDVPHNGHIKYRGTSAAVASAAEGAIFLLATCSTASNFPNFSYSFRLYYTDD
jgi:hypothetical protein